ncbi:type VI secretion system baseplate subunit TssG [Acidicapsa acidisoli]|uniref:type VI secretion system baseplate subunit TssG n=1 Tax=Acidicapsa acidisoli TaxID=1615681 RepID=UPI0021E0D609|nr:type VI secretion system baseplate subunit TssG [Acidicapsa acidisoli]
MGTESGTEAADLIDPDDPNNPVNELDSIDEMDSLDQFDKADQATPGASMNRMNSLLGEELVEDAHSFEFFQAVSLLQRLRADMRPVGGFSSPENEVVRFQVNQRLGFPASEIQKLELKDDAPAEMTVNFMGLTGPQGVLPYTYSELILERARAKDYSLAAFLDIFNHRAISLFYRAWQKSRFPVTYSSGKHDLFSHYLLDLVGLGTTGLRDRQEIDDEALLHYVGLIAMQSRSATALEQVLADYFEVPVEIQQFTGAWYGLDRSTQCMMRDEESPSSEVGSGAVVGDAIWDRQGRVRIRIGPLDMDRYNDFLPQGSAYDSLRAITRFFSNQAIDFEVQLVLDRSQVPAIELDLDSSKPARLGWVSWAKTIPLNADPDDTILSL